MNPSRPNLDLATLQQAVLQAMPGCAFTRAPEPFAWAPHMHLRAELTDGARAIPVILRRSWSEQAWCVEQFLYTSVLPRLAIRAPRLLAFFRNIDEAPWLVLEDLGSCRADPADPDHCRHLLHALGTLHGTPWQVQADWPADDPLPRYPRLRFPYDEWRALLADPPAGAPCLEPWIVEMLQAVLAALGRLPYALIHGDTDFSNAIACDGSIALIDWEYACLAPAALDLGRLPDHLRRPDALNSYRAGFAICTGRDLPPAEVLLWAQLGQAHECLRWVAHYLRRIDTGEPLDARWRARYFDPSLAALDHLWHSHFQKRSEGAQEAPFVADSETPISS